ncbi:hypothetical protein KIS1582_3069 [Cytobacillus firmus]|uniref:Uncharacterized protein n=1 Tax=Cytobacillus firmus TaxID=1399 RepID=A0A800N9V4_CYTFI|nr:hypothetical protein KIS1582_3069 [Cytobacillus firmus]
MPVLGFSLFMPVRKVERPRKLSAQFTLGRGRLLRAILFGMRQRE